jgi:uncharacterized protein
VCRLRAVPDRQDTEVTIALGLDEPEDEGHLRARVAAALGRSADDLPAIEVRKRSIDARGGRVRIHVLVGFAGGAARPLAGPAPREVDPSRRVIIVGDGPAGLFCAYELARHGIAATVLDRGKQVQPRRHDLKALNRRGAVDPDSNYCFGEGGAGTYSDGKLYTRSHKRGDVRDVIEVLALHGAPERILIDARPHIGSNRLPQVVTAIRERLAAVGVEFRFGARVTGLDLAPAGAGRPKARGVVLADGDRVGGEAVVMATGHSARDVLGFLAEAGVALAAKPFALGVRIEHPQALINQIQYGRAAGHPRLPAASYRLAHTAAGRGVFSFCMCPGGWIVPAATGPGETVVNGMSLSRRDSPFANSGLVVAVEPEDLARAGHRGPRAGIALQQAVERAAFAAGGEGLRAPATRLIDFLGKRGSTTVPESSYLPGLTATDLAEVFDQTGLDVAGRLREALAAFGRRLRGFVCQDAVLVGVESRTSCPVRVPRAAEGLESVDVAGLYPCGEGAGYAGGIVSAALDGVRVARAIAGRWAG